MFYLDISFPLLLYHSLLTPTLIMHMSSPCITQKNSLPRSMRERGTGNYFTAQ